MSIINGTVDAKIAVELGAAILLDKPIIVAVVRGTEVPEKLRRLADSIVEVDPDNPADCVELHRAVVELVDRLPRTKPANQ
ncbi:MAG: hypothetical protein IT428_26330 [Planctomycetaceae bacterium]|nr:hypothetical protein [Planctomycetaceae bacterium]